MSGRGRYGLCFRFFRRFGRSLTKESGGHYRSHHRSLAMGFHLQAVEKPLYVRIRCLPPNRTLGRVKKTEKSTKLLTGMPGVIDTARERLPRKWMLPR